MAARQSPATMHHETGQLAAKKAAVAAAILSCTGEGREGKFTKSQDEVGRSLPVDRRKHAKTKVKSGEGDRGDR